MLYSFLTALAFAASALAQNPTDGFNPITKPAQGEKVPTGSTYQIVWQPSTEYPGEITIGLLGGATPSTLSVVDTIAVGVESSTGSYSWQVDETLGDLATYGIMITLDSNNKIFQYGFPFHIVKGAKESSTTVSSSATSSATGSATGKETTVSAIITATETVSCSETSVIETKTSTSTSLSSAIFVNSTSTSTTVAAPSSTGVNGTTLSPSNTGGSGPVTVTSLVTSKTAVPIPPTTTSSIVTAGAASLGASSLALLGVVGVAVLAL
ncbi:Ser-Thr-rich glycosyl-phosphatidyl-inositol-anchored membrane family-domain-containing protein [Chaetomium strumarium]|uniref:Ser-Thr-rich glycosyl-phosphatidyl-inositol-anchored membrane family-domain-containing protein n=1 Tax=Chaetomium strumarium TaxID=1170767 RepID=A0AAJ0H1A2_9PEZI|nr:Ser-Thr-rich glycosyl-phosphatidyl-inositol-anchored membrane family-domain-containing protein [Chaetomium strumarium]